MDQFSSFSAFSFSLREIKPETETEELRFEDIAVFFMKGDNPGLQVEQFIYSYKLYSTPEHLFEIWQKQYPFFQF